MKLDSTCFVVGPIVPMLLSPDGSFEKIKLILNMYFV